MSFHLELKNLLIVTYEERLTTYLTLSKDGKHVADQITYKNVLRTFVGIDGFSIYLRRPIAYTTRYTR